MTNWNGPQPGPRALWHLIHANFPVARNLGIYNHRVVAGTHTLSHYAEGRALDIGLFVSRPGEKLVGDGLFKVFVDLATDLGLDEVIWNRQISSSRHPTIHHYSGVNPHTNHIHVGFTRDASQRTTFPSLFMVRIAILRTGLEDLAQPVGGATSIQV